MCGPKSAAHTDSIGGSDSGEDGRAVEADMRDQLTAQPGRFKVLFEFRGKWTVENLQQKDLDRALNRAQPSYLLT